MSSNKKLRIEITPDGKINAKTLGMTGDECLQYVTLLENLLDAEAIDSEFTEDYYQTTSIQQPVMEKRIVKGE
ncbi:DUF2997 domain-containing protein [Salipaludibacillus sp. LMS25]|jgi:hypothetical protein|uniref:DUF2997 domain-containing protein n=1 Tax=Salipaludibacillus sp. LMS25 TaxID=2924031 RepID=UPI0020D16C95|nr:DUF2997 domain-containing protein [Salipaludibacillus sp. LMS25]UTR13185.1 DUF2997 domain-containing protein [Salipaludibacillus sp. LMS25]